ncbi:MAG: hypothetical protein NVV59_09975 [Chitinophagaceae bacterium]|nr:hypothetical protein [Chitinophagaceae bacterium]
MKRLKIGQAVALLAIAVIISSCGSGRHYQSYPPPPPPRTSVSLILNGGPHLVVSRYHDGRYYYRSPNGYIYWRGPGNRYYLDRRYMQQSWRSHNQYRAWRRGR